MGNNKSRRQKMGISTEHGKWKKDHRRWLSENKKWRTDHKRVAQALRNLEQLIKKQGDEIKTFEKKAKASITLMAKKPHTASLHKRLKKAHQVQSKTHSLRTRARKSILKVTKAIENTIRQI
jgi:hypothetical protein